MDINQLEVFLSVAQEKSFSRAAEALHRTQPAVSQGIRRLEAELGEPLFDRSSIDGTLTAAGRVLFDFAQKMIVSVRELGAETFIAHNVPSPYRERVIKTFEKYRTPLNISMEMPTLEAIKRMVENGMGVALVPRLTVETEIERGLLAAITVKEMRLERRLYLIYRKGATLSHAAKAFLRVARDTRQHAEKADAVTNH